MKLVLNDGKEKHGKEKHRRIAGDGQSAHHWPSVALSVLLYPFLQQVVFLPDLSRIFSGRMHISSDFVYFPHISELFRIILDKFHPIFLILCDGKEEHENSR